DGLARTVTLSWAAATDDQTPQASILYDVYESTTPGIYDFSARPRATSTEGATNVVVSDLTPRSTLNWVVRARDQAFNRDTNLAEKSGDIKTSFSLNVLPIFIHNCAVVGCHVSGVTPVGLNLSPGFAYNFTVGRTAGEDPTRPRISQDPVDPLTN